jgi:hypothetical protein
MSRVTPVKAGAHKPRPIHCLGTISSPRIFDETRTGVILMPGFLFRAVMTKKTG